MKTDFLFPFSQQNYFFPRLFVGMIDDDDEIVFRISIAQIHVNRHIIHN